MLFFNAANELNLTQKKYKEKVKEYTLGYLKEDLGDHGDRTTKSFLGRPQKTIQAVIIAKEEGIVAGMMEAEWFMRQCGIKVLKKMKEGSILEKGSEIIRVSGSAQKILATERTLLNLIQRLSGIATATRKMSLQLPNHIKLLATRKTLWSDLDKRAVVVGGGWTHRLNLSDAILVKENHLKLSNDLEKSLVGVFKKSNKVRFIEVEVETIVQAKKIQEYYEKYQADYELQGKFAIMLDKFLISSIASIAPRLQQAGIVVEVSGNINAENIRKYIIKGVNAISAGCITNKAVSLDMSLDIL